MSFNFENGLAAQALYQEMAEKARRGYSVDTGGAVSLNSGQLGQSDTLSVEATDYWFSGGEVSASSQSIGIDASDPDDPRKDVVYLDGNGNAQVAKGDPNPVPDAQFGITTNPWAFYQPSPPALDGTDAVVLAEVWVAAGDTTVISDDVADRRLRTTVAPTFESDVDAQGNALSNVGAFDAQSGTVSDAPSNADDIARKEEVDTVETNLSNDIDSLENSKADDPHALGGSSHDADTLANLNSKVSDATLDDESSSRPPDNHASSHYGGGGDELDAADLSGASGSDGQVLQTDGNDPSWMHFSSGIQPTIPVDNWDIRETSTWYQNTTGNSVYVNVIADNNDYAGSTFHVNDDETDNVVDAQASDPETGNLCSVE